MLQNFHGMMQGGFRANELFGEEVGRFCKSWIFGSKARRKRITPHLQFYSLVTKESRYAATKVMVAYGTDNMSLCTGRWAVRAVRALQHIRRAGSADLLFTTHSGAPWTRDTADDPDERVLVYATKSDEHDAQ